MHDTHHLYYPRRSYHSKVERKFRLLKCNTVYIPRELHEWVEHTYGPPPKPSREAMLLKILRHARKECCCETSHLRV